MSDRVAVYCIAECSQERWQGEKWPLKIGLIKVGISGSPFGRLESMQTANSHGLILLELLWFRNRWDAQKAERWIHDFLKKLNITREWFDGRNRPHHEAFSLCAAQFDYEPETHQFWDLDDRGEMFLIEDPIVYPERDR